MANSSPLVDVMMRAAHKGGRVLARDFGEVENLQVSRKGPADFVTAADKMAEEKIFDSLRKDRPGYGYLMEESGVVEGTDKTHKFIIDPLDGTTNFMHANPHFAVSIGVERAGKLHAGVIYDVIRDEMFFAEAGKGAYMLDSRGVERRLRMPPRTDLSTCMIATGTPWKGKPGHGRFLTELHKVMAQVAGNRRFCSAALDLACLAAGRFVGFCERGLNIRDIAAGVVIVREANGLVTDLDTGESNGEHSGNLLCASHELLPILKKLL